MVGSLYRWFDGPLFWARPDLLSMEQAQPRIGDATSNRKWDYRSQLEDWAHRHDGQSTYYT